MLLPCKTKIAYILMTRKISLVQAGSRQMMLGPRGKYSQTSTCSQTHIEKPKALATSSPASLLSSSSCSKTYRISRCIQTAFSCCLSPPSDSIMTNYQRNMEVPNGVFRGVTDRFQGISIESKEEYEPDVDFAEKLNKSLEYWKMNKNRAIWFYVDISHSEWVPILARCGFNFHHAKQGKVTMYRWLPLEETINLPHYCHTMLGVGGIVINDDNEVLVVVDRNALIKGSWKLPGGYVEPGENLSDAAVREVFEETGIETEFQTFVCLRHSHTGNFGCSDLYIAVGLKPKTLKLTACDREIEKCAWMPIDEYLHHPNVHETNRKFVSTYMKYIDMGICFTCEEAKHQILKIPYWLYYMKPLEAQSEHDAKTKRNQEDHENQNNDGNIK